MGWYKSGTKNEVYSTKGLLQGTRKISTIQSNLAPKESWRTWSTKKAIIKIRMETKHSKDNRKDQTKSGFFEKIGKADKVGGKNE